MTAAPRNGRRRYTRESIERALDHHVRAGRIKGWVLLADGRYRIALNCNDDLYLRALRDVHLLIAGLASAGYAPPAAPIRAAVARYRQATAGKTTGDAEFTAAQALVDVVDTLTAAHEGTTP